MTVFNRIRSAIAVPHHQIEQTGYSIAIMSGRISASDYSVSLAQLHAVHGALENAVVGTAFESVLESEMVRTPALVRDLSHWGNSLRELDTLPETIETCELIRTSIANDPISAIGFIYVLEGSRMGSLVIVKPLARALGVMPTDSQGLDYHTEGARQTPARLARWKAEQEQRDWNDASIAVVESAAVRLMESLNRLYAVLPAASNATQTNQADAA